MCDLGVDDVTRGYLLALISDSEKLKLNISFSINSSITKSLKSSVSISDTQNR